LSLAGSYEEQKCVIWKEDALEDTDWWIGFWYSQFWALKIEKPLGR
jgi:hypothetical protein